MGGTHLREHGTKKKAAMKRLLLLMALAGQGICLTAQTLRLPYATEVQYNFKGDCNWVHLLRPEMSFPLDARSSLELATYHAAKTARERIVPDLQTFSNIELDQRVMPCALAVAGYARSTERSLLFIGIRNVNEDYFADPATSLFTNSSNGIFPTLSANLPLPNYPLSAWGVHYAGESRRLGWQASLYNGRSGGGWHAFSFRPQHDGFFFIADGLYKAEKPGGRYHAGIVLHEGFGENVDGVRQTARRCVRGAWWVYGEQKLGRALNLLAQYSEAFGGMNECRRYGELGCVWETGGKKGGRLGLSCQHAAFPDGGEWSGEVTYRRPLAGCIDCQPSFQLIHNRLGTFTAVSLRLSLSLCLLDRRPKGGGKL